MRTLFIAWIVIVLHASNAAAGIIAGPITNPANAHVYYLLANDVWTNSEAIAVSLGGRLVTIEDTAENDWVFATFGTYGGVNRVLWIGLTDQQTEGTYLWSSGSTSTYRKWAPGEPNNLGDEDFACIFPPGHAYAGSWADAVWYNTNMNGVVEVPSTNQPVIAGPITNAANGHYYYLLPNATWTNSQLAARRLGGHLATVDDAQEDAWIFSTFGGYGGEDRILWIGLNDANVEGFFTWISGEASSFRNWAPGEPNNIGNVEDFACYFSPGHEYAGRWNDGAWFDDRMNGVVEVDPSPRPRLDISVASVALKWPSQAGTQYQIEYRSPLTGNTWTNLGSAITGNGSNIVVTESVLDDPAKLFRLRILP